MAASQRNHDQNSDPQPCKTCWSRLIPVIMFETLKGRLTAVLSLLLLFPLCHINLPAARLCKTSYVSGSTFGSTFKHRPAAFCHTVSICSGKPLAPSSLGGARGAQVKMFNPFQSAPRFWPCFAASALAID